MSNNDENQQEVKKIINLYELQPELIAAKLILEKVLTTICSDDTLMQKIYKASGDSATGIIWYVQQVIKYLEVIIENNQLLLDPLAGKF